MSEFDKKNEGGSKFHADNNGHETIHINRQDFGGVAGRGANDVHLIQKESTSNIIKNVKPEVVRAKSAAEIFHDSFMVRIDKDGNIKPAKIAKADLKLLCSIEKSEPFSTEVLAAICQDAIKTDLSLDCLTEIFLGLMDVRNRDSVRMWIDCCVRIASGVWINKHQGSFDLFRDIFDVFTDTKDHLQYLEEILIKKYEIRSSVHERDKDEEFRKCGSIENIELISSGHSLQKSDHKQDKKILGNQKDNLLIIGSFWLLDREHVSYQLLIDYLIKKVDAKSANKTSMKDMAVYLAQQCMNPDGRFTRILSMCHKDIDGLKKIRDELNRQISHHDDRISSINQQFKNQISLSEAAEFKIENLKSEVNSLQKTLEEQRLDEMAKRTHLRDSEGQVKARAVNLLSEEVLEPLRLSLAALQREIPKADVAAHHVELAIECIEREMKWFKE